MKVQRPSLDPSRIGVSAARIAIAACLLALAACGGSDSSPPVSLSGTVSGLTTDGLTLASNGVNLPISAGAKTFSFGQVLTDEVGYDVIVAIQPSGQACTVTNGSGVAATANISNVVVTCSDRTFTVGGTISGLTVAGLELANGSDTLSVAAGASSFTMPAAVAYGSAYAVTVAKQPAGLTCDVTNGTGTISASAVTNIAVTCTDKPLTVGGSISGLGDAAGLVLGNGSDTYAVPPGATSFTFGAPQSTGSPYTVRVQSQPAGRTCSAADAPGTLPTHSVTDVSITCSDQAYALGGTIAGLTSDGLVLREGADTLAVTTGATRFTMPEAVAYAGRYAVGVQTQPAGLTCTVSRAAGTMPATAVTDIEVTCASSSHTLGGSISGLTAAGLVLTDGMESLSVAANAALFSMPNALADGSDYDVTIKTQPSGARCRIANGRGTVTGDVDTVQVTCEPAAPAQ
jgi:hypothetical protein